ncbi:hypothetical protein [Desulfovibrio sp. TomC]|uniref:hypothetical protein n=1 Tax=Desulfovibrio sp. TomC TaxID=1562888 RepID=UPI0005731D51|nr:hypothetical protein [Desulfovibrio sp. TomC]KHK04297.1 putative lipoprotein [Desulfovibrio sp. TomC]
MRSKRLAYLGVALVGLSLMAGCVRQNATTARAPVATDAGTSAVAFLGKNFAVIPFTIPATDADLLAGYLPAARVVPEVAPVHLDAAMDQALAGSKQTIVPGKLAASCAKSAPRGNESGRLATLQYYQNVGKCAGVDFVVVPMVIDWRERVGSEIGSTNPASVDFVLYLIDVRTGGLVKQFHFDETQKSLSANILDARKFVARNGRWLSAMELAQEGLKQGLGELGL